MAILEDYWKVTQIWLNVFPEGASHKNFSSWLLIIPEIWHTKNRGHALYYTYANQEC